MANDEAERLTVQVAYSPRPQQVDRVVLQLPPAAG